MIGAVPQPFLLYTTDLYAVSLHLCSYCMFGEERMRLALMVSEKIEEHVFAAIEARV